MIIVVRSVFHEDNNYYSQAFFIGECLYKLKMLEYDKIDVSEGINVNKTNGCVIIKFAITGTFYNKFRYQSKVRDSCRNLMQQAISFDDIAIVSVKENNYRIHFRILVRIKP